MWFADHDSQQNQEQFESNNMVEMAQYIVNKSSETAKLLIMFYQAVKERIRKLDDKDPSKKHGLPDLKNEFPIEITKVSLWPKLTVAFSRGYNIQIFLTAAKAMDVILSVKGIHWSKIYKTRSQARYYGLTVQSLKYQISDLTREKIFYE